MLVRVVFVIAFDGRGLGGNEDAEGDELNEEDDDEDEENDDDDDEEEVSDSSSELQESI